MKELVHEFIAMVLKLAKPGKAILDSLTELKCHLLHMAVGLIGEVAELKEAEIKRDRDNFVEELGDYEFYLQGIYQSFDDRRDTTEALSKSVRPVSFGECVDDLHIASGNLLDKIKRLTIYNKPIDDNEILNLADNCFSVLYRFYEGNAFGITREEVLEGNIKKLLKGDRARYKEGSYSDAQANNRADKEVPVKVSQLKEEVIVTAQDLQILEQTFNFGCAIAELKIGNKVARKGWNGKGMFLFLVPGSTFQVNRAPLLGIYPEGTTINYCPHVDMRTADGSIVPWLASQTDILAEDWMVVNAI